MLILQGSTKMSLTLPGGLKLQPGSGMKLKVHPPYLGCDVRNTMQTCPTEGYSGGSLVLIHYYLPAHQGVLPFPWNKLLQQQGFRYSGIFARLRQVYRPTLCTGS